MGTVVPMMSRQTNPTAKQISDALIRPWVDAERSSVGRFAKVTTPQPLE